MSGQIDVVDLNIEAQELKEQLKLLENIVTEQQQETRYYIKKVPESSPRVSKSSLNTRKLSRDTLVIKNSALLILCHGLAQAYYHSHRWLCPQNSCECYKLASQLTLSLNFCPIWIKDQMTSLCNGHFKELF